MPDPVQVQEGDATQGTGNRRDEYQGLSKEQQQDLRLYLDGLSVAQDYTKPFFQEAVRFLRLYDGFLPEELNGTFSRVMLNIPFEIVDNEIPRTMRGLNIDDFFDLDPMTVDMEEHASEAKKWLKYQMSVTQKLSVTLLPTVQSTYACGNGYRVYTHKYQPIVENRRVPDKRAMGIPVTFKDEQVTNGYNSIISGQYAHFFSILPQPGGAMPNAVDKSSEDVIDGLHWIGYMTKQSIKDNVKKHGWDGSMAERLFKNIGTDEQNPARDYIQQLAPTTRSGMYGGDPVWIKSIRSKNKDLTHRYRVGWFFQRDKWIVVAEGKYPLWSGKPIIDAIPVSNHKAIPMLGNWFGRSMIGLSEDLIVSMLQNYNARLDYLAQTLHPGTYIPQMLLDHHGGDKSVFDPKPYQVIDFPKGIEPTRDIYHDRYPEISQQAFFEERSHNQMLQQILGQPNFLSGQGAGGQADSTATGFQGLISEGNVRMLQRAMNFEATGIKDDLWLTLKYGAKYIDENVMVRMKGLGGSPWYDIAHEAITDGYGIEVKGTNSLSLKEETFRKMLSMGQFLLNNPAVENQKELVSQMMRESDAFTNVEEIIGGVGEQTLPAEAGVPGQAQQGGQGPIQNEIRSAANRNEVQANTGALVPANNLLV